jgi:hypothetical protein
MTAVRFEAQLEAGIELRIDLHPPARAVTGVGSSGVVREIIGHEAEECGVHCRFSGSVERQEYRLQSERGKPP